MQRTPKLLAVIATLVSTVAFAGVGWAYWSAGGSGSASATVGTLTVPGTPAGTVASGTVSLSWTASTVSGGGLVKYHVQRSPDAGASWADACGSTAGVPISGLSCSDTPGAGTYKYTVTAIYRSWTAQSGASGAVIVRSTPTVTSVSPASRAQGATNQTVTLTGTGFASGTGLAVSFSGGGITVNSTTFVSATQVTASITIAAGAATGARTVTVTNPDGGTGTKANGFTVTAAPTISSPTSGSPFTLKHNQTGTLTITGTGFQSGITVSFSGGFTTSGAITLGGSTQISVPVTATNSQNTYNLTITNPDGGTAVSAQSMVNN